MNDQQPVEPQHSERQQIIDLLRFLGVVVAGVILTSLAMVLILNLFS